MDWKGARVYLEAMDVETVYAGREVECPSCGAAVVVPAGEGAGAQESGVRSQAAPEEIDRTIVEGEAGVRDQE